MSLPVRLVGASGRTVEVTALGQLVVAPLAYDETQFLELEAANTAYNFYLPKSGKQFIITTIIAYADKQVGTTTNATVVIYEATAPDTTTTSKVLLQYELGQNQSLPISPLQIKVAQGVWVNAKTDDDDIHMTIMGYYIDQID